MTIDALIQTTVERVFRTQFKQFEDRLLEKLKPDNLLTVSECMEITKLSRQTVLMWIKNDKIKYKIIGNRYRVLESDLHNYINNTK